MVRQLPYDSDWATRSIKGKPRDLDDRPGPRTVQLDGARYKVDSEEGYVSWMGWQFYMSFERDMGLHLWDMYVHLSLPDIILAFLELSLTFQQFPR